VRPFHVLLIVVVLMYCNCLLLTVVVLMYCNFLLAGLPALPVKESASTLRMDIRALMAWTDRHKPVSFEILHHPQLIFCCMSFLS